MTNEELVKIIAQAAKDQISTLNLADNNIEVLPPEIAQLTNLTVLSLRNNQLSTLPPEFAQLTNLTGLSLSDNQLSTLPPEIAQLTNLTRLFLHNNQLSILPPEIAQLTNLTQLDLYNNQLSILPPEIAQLTNLTQLDLYNNPLTSPPPEIVEQGIEAVLAYLQEQWQASQRQWVSKLLVVGEGGVGKTCMLRALRGEEFEEQNTTHGIEINSWSLIHPTEADVTMQLNSWDFGGQEIYHATHQFFLTNRSLFLLVWNARHGFDQGKLYYWLDTIEALAPESPIIIVATHIDQRDADLPLIDLRRKYPQIIGQCTISNTTGEGILTLRQTIAETAAQLPLMGEIWPTTWLNGANAIRELTEKYITPQKLEQIMAEQGIDSDKGRILIQWLHELGEILYFQDNEELNDIVILKPQWVTEYISKVLESEEVINQVGIFTRTQMKQLWQDLMPSMQNHFLRLMERFDLSYRTLEDKEISLVVERLPLDEPDYHRRWEQIKGTDNCQEISLKWRLNTIPAGIPTWFIARQHRFSTHTHWRTGALFTYEREGEGKHLALAKAFPRDRYVELTVRGGNPHNFFALLKDGMELVLNRFPGLQIERKIPCPGHNGQPCTHEFNYQQLLKRIGKKDTIECPESLEDLSVMELLYGVHWSTQNKVLDRLNEIMAGQDEILDELNNLRELTQREFTKAFHREQAKIESHCPNIFVLRPHNGKKWHRAITGTKIDLQLYCQAPGCWHPTAEGGLYTIDEPAKWLRATAPYIRRLVGVLKYAAPLVGPWLVPNPAKL